MKRFIAGLGMFCLYLGTLLLLLHIVGTDDLLYHRLQLRANVLDEAGITDRELIDADAKLAKYLAGDRTALQDSPFGTDELLHMEDCYALFVLLRKMIAVTFLLAGILIILARVCGVRDFRKPSLCASCFLLLLLGALAVWGMADFTSLFTVMHKLLFTNGLWLMDPETQLMIRICPESMFSTMAAIIGGSFTAFMVMTNLFCSLFRGGRKNK